MNFKIITNLEDVRRIMFAMPAKADKALSQALHFAAKIAQGHVIQELPNHFKIRSKWVPGSIRLRSLGQHEVAIGVAKGSAFMEAQEVGGEKAAKDDAMAIPIGPAASRAKGETSPPFRGSGLMGKTLRGRWPSNLPRAFNIKTANNRTLVVQVKGRGQKSHLQVAYILKKRVKIKARWNFRKRVTEIAKAYVPRLFVGYLSRAVRR